MPRAKKVASGDAEHLQVFVRVSWTQAVDSAYTEWLEQQSATDQYAAREELLLSGLDFKVGSANGGIFASLIDRAREVEKKPFILSGWGEDRAEAINVLLYKHLVMLERDWDSGEVSLMALSKRR